MRGFFDVYMDQTINSESFELIQKELNLSDQAASMSGEEKLKKILNESDPDYLASDLAHALWTRQKQKVEIRRRYS